MILNECRRAVAITGCCAVMTAPAVVEPLVLHQQSAARDMIHFVDTTMARATQGTSTESLLRARHWRWS